jgi:uncharacterized protein (TIGR03000 family)
MYGIVLMMTISGGADLPSNDLFEPATKLTEPAYRHRRGGCCGGCNGGGCYGGGGCHGGGRHGCHGGCHGGYAGGCHGGYAGGCYGGYAGYAWGGYPAVYSGYAYWGMPYTTYSTYPVLPNGNNVAPVEESSAPPPSENLPPEARLPRNGNMAPIFLTVKVPADAQLLIDGTPTRSTSETRTFISPPVQTGRDFKYIIRAGIQRDGKMTWADKEVTVRAGQENTVQLDAASFNPERK